MRVRTVRSEYGLTAPRTATFVIAVILGLLGTALHYKWVTIAELSPYSFLLVVSGLALLALGCALRGL